MTQNEFDRILMDEAGQLPPQDYVVAATTPLRAAMSKIMWGMALTTFKFEFFYLQYILPLLGAVLMYLGYRSLRKENKWFKLCWLLSGLRLVWHGVFDVLTATPLLQKLIDSPLNWPLSVFLNGVSVVLLFSLRAGLRTAFSATGEPQPRDWLGRGLAAYLLSLAIAIWSELFPLTEPSMFGISIKDGWELVYYGQGIAFAVLQIYLLVCIEKQSLALAGRGYAVTPVPVKYSARTVLLGVFGAVLLSIPVVSYVGSHISMPPAEVLEQTLTAEQEVTRQRLISLGLPEELAEILDEDELDACTGAYAVLPCRAYDSDLTDEETLLLNGDASVLELDGCTVELSSYIVFLSETQQRRYQYFEYVDMPSLRLQEQFSVDPIGNYPTSVYAGRIAWEDDGLTYAVTPEVQTSGGQTAEDLDEMTAWLYQEELERFGHLHYSPYFNFTIPKQADTLRGYLAYTMDTSRDLTPYELGEWCVTFLRRQTGYLHYPFISIDDYGGTRSGTREGHIAGTYAHFDYYGPSPAPAS